MKRFIKASCYYHIISHESAEHGDYHATGEDFLNEEYTSEELLHYVRHTFGVPSEIERPRHDRLVLISDDETDVRWGHVKVKSLFVTADRRLLDLLTLRLS